MNHSRDNVLYCLDRHPSFAKLDKKSRASLFGVAPTTIARWPAGKGSLKQKYVIRTSEITGIPIDRFELHPSKFRSKAERAGGMKEYRGVKLELQLPSIVKHQYMWSECQKRVGGSYIMYTRSLSNPLEIAKSLLRIRKKTSRGIEFDIHNVENRPNPAEPHIYYYEGLLFPIHDSLLYIGEEASHDEPLAMITDFPQLVSPPLLVGFMLAVGVKPGVRNQSGSRLIAKRRSVKLIEVAALTKELGVFEAAKIDSATRALLIDDPQILQP